jgi:hypothetical protein
VFQSRRHVRADFRAALIGWHEPGGLDIAWYFNLFYKQTETAIAVKPRFVWTSPGPRIKVAATHTLTDDRAGY